ncbi:MAG TPA: glycosyltransferase family 1 protein, partial [Thermoanaerobaculia bacterium]|nr:glycosyltransferase family 1 protein [Thermoanaerobaculia bacterium]
MTESTSLPRKVLMTTDTVGGVWQYSLELARGLGERGIEVALATMGGPINELQRDKVDRIPGLRVFESHHKLEWMEDPWR